MTEPDKLVNPPAKHWARLLAAARIVAAILLLAAAALPLSAPATPSASAQAEASFAEEEGEGEEVEWEIEEEEEEEEEEDFDKGGTPGSAVLPPDCLLRTAKPAVVTQLDHASLTLTLRYTTADPVTVGIDFWLKGSKGTLEFDSDTRHFAKQGVLRMSRHLEEREMAKVRAARAFMVHLDIPEAPSYCARYLTLRLTAKHSTGSHATWSVPLERRS